MGLEESINWLNCWLLLSINFNDLPPSEHFTWEHTVEHFTCFAEGYVKVQGDLLEFTQQIASYTGNNRK